MCQRNGKPLNICLERRDGLMFSVAFVFIETGAKLLFVEVEFWNNCVKLWDSTDALNLVNHWMLFQSWKKGQTYVFSSPSFYWDLSKTFFLKLNFEKNCFKCWDSTDALNQVNRWMLFWWWRQHFYGKGKWRDDGKHFQCSAFVFFNWQKNKNFSTPKKYYNYFKANIFSWRYEFICCVKARIC